ncbi:MULTISPECIES: MSHA biogenesis protein MshK [unclassified Duganella]|uniref:MSHA biogenesis protein MshK n=1 Tax=unclassified Duganella TaxID=2636909 RepID=UPI000E35195F|nr:MULTISPECIES: MSHA biogenesis protein MshK [unclassified Duganella]RFP13807.1 MSHA biogenesis protein MshK [Duganella sp. BJB475]RFP36515.1 MSHA biogenesis protein MshK [Duganella sp. BJB476]
MNRRLTSLLPLMLPLMLALPASAQKLADPTRPPALMAAPESEAAAEAVAAGPRLQSILIGRAPDGRRLAVIDGATLRIGGKVGDAVLERINDNSVVLRRGKNLETLTLFPKPAEAADPTGKTK